MPDLLIRDLAPEMLAQLKAAARAHGRSVQAEVHDILRQSRIRHLAETRRLSARWLKRLRDGHHSDSVQLIREDRDAR